MALLINTQHSFQFCIDLPRQEILSKDSVSVAVDAVLYFRVRDPVASVNNINNAPASTRLLAETTLRNVLGVHTLTEILSQRDSLTQQTLAIVDEATDNWGIKVSSTFSLIPWYNESS